MVTRIGAFRIAAEILGQALLDLATQLTDEPDLKSPVAEPLHVIHEIGVGGPGLDSGYPECQVCWARGGGGHGGFCPNSGKRPEQWVLVPPPGYQRPPKPEGWPS